ncbi:hypothetical protein CEXT_709241 [Caerostris extrusa]|uniref:Uncharacterized protein n=1 Tax=Caerostris extrusa TaxID=172846 RepID=A0AAV4P8J2_CAEEX|nr:hypothetical protein CEXT_709241 [Caerostris extrusa]
MILRHVVTILNGQNGTFIRRNKFDTNGGKFDNDEPNSSIDKDSNDALNDECPETLLNDVSGTLREGLYFRSETGGGRHG